MWAISSCQMIVVFPLEVRLKPMYTANLEDLTGFKQGFQHGSVSYSLLSRERPDPNPLWKSYHFFMVRPQFPDLTPWKRFVTFPQWLIGRVSFRPWRYSYRYGQWAERDLAIDFFPIRRFLRRVKWWIYHGLANFEEIFGYFRIWKIEVDSQYRASLPFFGLRSKCIDIGEIIPILTMDLKEREPLKSIYNIAG
jgi:hypothetical protein